MDWTAQIDAYCERTDPGLWSEPLNAVTNLAFLLAAIVMWRRTPGLPGAMVLCAILFAIGIGSALFHTFATAWAAAADTIPIGLFILTYIFLLHRDLLGLRRLWALGAVVAFFPYAALMVPVLNTVPFLAISNFYWTVPILLALYALGLARTRPALARGLATGAAILTLSITLRSLDETLCEAVPIGTHLWWHLLNALMLGYMIHVYAGQMLAGDRRGG